MESDEIHELIALVEKALAAREDTERPDELRLSVQRFLEVLDRIETYAEGEAADEYNAALAALVAAEMSVRDTGQEPER
jgi:hypothetical protein